MHTYHSAIKMKPVDVKPNTCLNSSEEINDANPKFKGGDIFRISKYKSIFAKGYVPNWSEEVFVTFYETKLRNSYQKKFRFEIVIKTKGCKLYGKWKRCNNSFNSWIDKKRHSIIE